MATTQWKKDNQERVKEYNRYWNKANPEKIKESRNRWNQANPERVRENSKRWKKNNPEKVREGQRRWCKANLRKPVRNKWGSKKKIEQMNLDRELKKPFLPEYVDPKWEKKLKVEN